MSTIPGRKCPKCSKIHNTVLEDTSSGEVIEYLEKCKECLLGFGSKEQNKKEEHL